MYTSNYSYSRFLSHRPAPGKHSHRSHVGHLLVRPTRRGEGGHWNACTVPPCIIWPVCGDGAL